MHKVGSMSLKIALVTGASGGIGKAAAELLAANGYYVFAVARRMEMLEPMSCDQIEPIRLDVVDAEGIRSVVEHIIATKGRIDVLVNNAAYGQLGAIECVSMEAAHQQFEVNVFGYARFIQAVLPHMRYQKSGRIINITSILGRVPIPGFGWYAASKHAVEALSETLRGELMGSGIDVVVIAPGLIKTEFVPKQLALLETIPHPPVYQKLLAGIRILLVDEPRSPGPDMIAHAILEASTASHPPIRHALPIDSKMAIMARWLMGPRLFSWAIRYLMKI